MHYYKRNIGDYAKKAGRLSMLEHGAYTLLIDSCYDRERFPTRSEALEWCWARTEAEVAAVDFVLSRFFVLEGDVYTQKRIAEELSMYQQSVERNSRIATEREKKRRERARLVNESSPPEHESPPNHKPLTINQEPLTNKKDKNINNPASAKAEPDKRRKTKLPNDFELTDEMRDWALNKWAEAKRGDIKPDEQFERFVNHHTSRGTTLLDWKAGWRTWVSNAIQFTKPPVGQAGGGYEPPDQRRIRLEREQSEQLDKLFGGGGMKDIKGEVIFDQPKTPASDFLLELSNETRRR